MNTCCLLVRAVGGLGFFLLPSPLSFCKKELLPLPPGFLKTICPPSLGVMNGTVPTPSPPSPGNGVRTTFGEVSGAPSQTSGPAEEPRRQIPQSEYSPPPTHTASLGLSPKPRAYLEAWRRKPSPSIIYSHICPHPGQALSGTGDSEMTLAQSRPECLLVTCFAGGHEPRGWVQG